MSTWDRFTHDPRVHPGLRAADTDRDVVRALLTEGYADGRLGAVEHEERSNALWRATTLGELMALISDLVPVAEHGLVAPAPPSPPPPSPPSAGPSLRRQLAGFVVPSLVCVLLWALAPHVFWPAWVMVYTGIPVLRTLLHRVRLRR